MEKFLIKNENLSLAVFQTGNKEGRPIIFLHGMSSSHLSFWEQYSKENSLTKNFRLIFVDLRGHGSSDKPMEKEHYTDSKTWANDLKSVIETLKLEKPVVIGWSYGGLVINDYIRHYGDGSLGGIIYLSAAFTTGKGMEKYAGPALGNTMKFLSLGQQPDFATLTESVIVGCNDCFEKEVSKEFYARLLCSSMGCFIVPHLVARDENYEDDMKKLKVPVVIIQGDKDKWISMSMAEWAKQVVPNAELVVFEGCGHSCFAEEPDRFNELVTKFTQALK
ncbi:cis-3-alkyl-4-alkyloxetan-2-one decarboxylase [Anaeramoeba ignava]|uniref:Cis-3-alkyl-4-alkyloxetan-2-one decarboxylase n=1 Tax=Anaeramoeba ignava TaxID=1746090 RepID=A0A9Q0RIV1_ANAIG|nr:cis-3-alkyl-4-alkyloxetan-2-one decarboxylase [Anaeramoeba ignava]